MAVNESRLIITVDADKLQESVSEAFRPLREAVEAMRAKLDELGKLAANWQVNLPGPVIHEPEPITQDTSDGYHTFGELYAHRRALTAALAAAVDGVAWRSKAHHPDDEPIHEGYFIVGIDLPPGMVTYHYELAYWDDFRHVEELERAPKWDGATPDDTVARLLEWARA